MTFSSPARVTVSIITFRTDLATLSATIDSLRTSTVPLSLVIVDNSPEESYFEKLRTIPDVTLVRAPRNGGYGFGHNLALSHSEPAVAYHLVLNPDVIVHAGCIERLLELLDYEPDVALAMPKILNRDGSLQYLNKEDPTVLDLALRRFAPGFVQRLPFVRRRMDWFTRKSYGYDQRSEILYASGCFMLFRRNILDKIAGFDERFFMYFEDADISRRARALGRVVYIPEAVITHYWSRGSHHSWQLMACTLSSAHRYFKKWGWKLW